MKNTKKCPKCGSSDIFMVKGNAGAYGSGNNIPVGLTIFTYIPVDRYICGRCGYSEEWIRKEDVSDVRTSKRARELQQDE